LNKRFKARECYKTRSKSIEPIETVSFTAPDNDSIYSSSIQSTSTIFSYNYIIESILFEINNNLKIDKNKIGFIFSQYSTHEFNEFDNIGGIFQRIFKELKMFQ
jgi:putative ubiquitin-RnfH superfamily antitoxin RatB of RatAB toxin-antitoxin module